MNDKSILNSLKRRWWFTWGWPEPPAPALLGLGTHSPQAVRFGPDNALRRKTYNYIMFWVSADVFKDSFDNFKSILKE